jgi:hypothetical protein
VPNDRLYDDKLTWHYRPRGEERFYKGYEEDVKLDWSLISTRITANLLAWMTTNGSSLKIMYVCLLFGARYMHQYMICFGDKQVITLSLTN